MDDHVVGCLIWIRLIHIPCRVVEGVEGNSWPPCSLRAVPPSCEFCGGSHMLMVLRERPLVRVVIRHKESRVVIANVFVTQHTFAHPAVITADI